jgi:hypothetical protein
MSKQKALTLGERLTQVEDFAAYMKQRIIEEETAGRDEWDTWTTLQLMVRVQECTSELFTALSGGLTPDEFARCCANLANYAMIVATHALKRGLDDTKPMRAPGVRLP